MTYPVDPFKQIEIPSIQTLPKGQKSKPEGPKSSQISQPDSFNSQSHLSCSGFIVHRTSLKASTDILPIAKQQAQVSIKTEDFLPTQDRTQPQKNPLQQQGLDLSNLIDENNSSQVKARNSNGDLVTVFTKDTNYAPFNRFIYSPQLSSDGKSVELYYPIEGRKFDVFASINIDDPKQITILAEDPNHDVRRVLRDPHTQEPLAYSYLDTGGDLSIKWKAIKPEFQEKLNKINSIIIANEGERKSSESISINEDGKWEVFVHYSNTPDRKYTLNLDQNNDFQILNIERSNKKLNPDQLVKSQAIKLKGAKGQDLTALITIPIGYESAKDLPVVVMPHGGPESHFYQRYDENVQFLVNRGFVVLQLNHSGSTGHGRELVEDIHQNFKLAAQDLISMTKDAIKKGIISPDSLSSFGHSFGAYSVAKANELEPELFSRSIIYNGPLMPWTKLGEYMLTTDRIPHEAEHLEPRQQHANLINFVTAQDGSDDIDFSKITTPTTFMYSSSDDNIVVPSFQELDSHVKSMPAYREMNEFQGQRHVFQDQSVAVSFFERVFEFLTRDLPQEGVRINEPVIPKENDPKIIDQGMRNEWRR